ncbi:hypothetical protein K469DRAFT_198561 [Zopfia rhizophila CBS 207.26]|uniref:Uncharacterized protein n=1 Tax=Zopfia rhizophila CBS 207.26 TaxID=1314779 RepID=A0A6A6DWL4_9PEZI|nr:hypothetical protein K469DRAFT_198561 [Zopfia rhizophila CBS 207.26]
MIVAKLKPTSLIFGVHSYLPDIFMDSIFAKRRPLSTLFLSPRHHRHMVTIEGFYRDHRNVPEMLGKLTQQTEVWREAVKVTHTNSCNGFPSCWTPTPLLLPAMMRYQSNLRYARGICTSCRICSKYHPRPPKGIAGPASRKLSRTKSYTNRWLSLESVATSSTPLPQLDP